MKINNKDLIQSYILTTARYDYSVYEKRILYRIIEMLQQYTAGIKLNQKYEITESIFKDLDIKMPISAYLKNEQDNNYSRIKAALLSLNAKRIEIKNTNVIEIYNLIERPKIYMNEGYITFRLPPIIHEAFLDFSKGFSKYELITAMEFESVYSMRFYELFSTQKNKIIYRIETLKQMFKVEDKYKKNNDFIRKVVEVAKKELDEKSPYSFEFSTNKSGRAIDSINFYPVYQPKNRDTNVERKELQKATSLRHDLDVVVINYLKENYSFTDTEIKNNLDLFTLAQEKLDFLYFLGEQKRKSTEKDNPKGWIINAIKTQCEQIKPKKTTKKL
jgi:plasmid replication initiation protein